MSNQVDFLPFAIGNGANVSSQSDYAALAAILTGFQSGPAKSAQVNKAIRQGTVMAAVLANFIANNANVNVLDNGDTGTLLTNFVAALKAANASAGFLNKSNNLSDVLSAATALANLGGLAKANNLSDIANSVTALTNLGGLAINNNFSEIAAKGAATVATALANINGLNKNNNLSDLASVSQALTNLGLGGLGAGSALPVGVPVPWPTATPPTGWLKCNGATFSATTYPQLAVIFPSLILPDLRGEFIRGWDDSRGIDAGRVLLSDQLGTFVSVDINYADSGLVGAIGTIDGSGGIGNVNGDTITTPLTKTAFQYANVSGMAASTSLPGNTVATRPRNVAFNYIVRAA